MKTVLKWGAIGCCVLMFLCMAGFAVLVALEMRNPGSISGRTTPSVASSSVAPAAKPTSTAVVARPDPTLTPVPPTAPAPPTAQSAAAQQVPPKTTQPQSAAKPADKPSDGRFGSGTKVVGSDIQPGTYRSNNKGGGCYWARLKGMGGSLSDLIANDNALGPAVVTILPSDKGFTSSRCEPWVPVTGPVTASPDAPIGDGTWVVGTDIAPGLWKADGTESCYWQRSSSFEGGLNGILANENARGSAVVQVAPNDKGFTSKRCGTWTKAG